MNASSFAAEALRFAAPADGDVGVDVPVTVGGAVAALLYADDGGEEDRTVPASWPVIWPVWMLVSVMEAKTLWNVAEGAPSIAWAHGRQTGSERPRRPPAAKVAPNPRNA